MSEFSDRLLIFAVVIPCLELFDRNSKRWPSTSSLESLWSTRRTALYLFALELHGPRTHLRTAGDPSGCVVDDRPLLHLVQASGRFVHGRGICRCDHLVPELVLELLHRHTQARLWRLDEQAQSEKECAGEKLDTHSKTG